MTQHSVMSSGYSDNFSQHLVFVSGSCWTTAQNLTSVGLLNSCRGGECSMLHLHITIRNPTAWWSQRAMKRLGEKTTNRGDLDDEAFDRRLLEFRNLHVRLAYQQPRFSLVILFGPLSRPTGQLSQIHGSNRQLG